MVTTLRKRAAAPARKAKSSQPAKPTLAELDETRSLDDESTTSDDNEDDDGADFKFSDKTPRRAKRRAATTKAKSHGLVGSLKAKNPPVATLAREWGQRAIDDFGPAAAELVIVLAAAAGDAEYRVPDADQDSAETMIATAAQRASFKKLKGAEWRNFHVNFERFWAALTQDAQAESMANSIVECASVCAVKALRLQGTIAGMACGMGLLEKRVKVLDELARTRRMFDAEVDACVSKMADGAKKTSLAEATAALREALDAAVHAVGRQVSQAELQTQQATNAEDTEDPVCETVQDCTDEWREQGRGNVLTDKARQLAIDCVRLCKEVRVLERKALEGKDAVFQVIATKRFRDVDAEIRAATGELLGRWASVCPEALATTQRSKYLGWMLFDKHADVRLAALHALGKVFEDMDAAQALESFVARFAPRVKGCLFDPEPKVIVAALHVSKVWLARGLLKPEDGEHLVECERCLFVDDLPVREAAARFTMQAHEADMGKAQESVARRLRGLCDVIVAHLEGRECHELVAGVVEAFWAVDKAAMGNFGELVQLLAEGNLSAEVARVAASMLVAAVECNKGKLPSAVASALPGLVVTHRTNARVEQCLVDLVARSEIGAWASDAALDKLVRELKWCVMENRRESDLAFSAFAALAHLAQDKQPGKRKVEKALEDLVGELQECEPTARNLAVLASFLLSTGAPARGVVDKIDLMDIASVAAEQADVELLASSLKLGFAVVAADAAAADAVGAEASGLRASRETLVNVLSVALRSDLAECALLAVGLLHDTRVLLSPVQQGTHGGWVAPADMLAQADAVLSKAVGGVDKGADPQDALCTMLLAHGLCETAVLPACRAALFATSREDVRSLAHVLRLLVTSDLPGMERETKALVDEMLDEDAARLMQAGLEAVEAGGAELGERIVAKLAHKASLSEPAGRMLRRAIVKGLAREELGVFRGLGAFCQLLKGAEKKRTLDAWNTALAAKKASDAEFDSRLEAGELGDVLEFEACLNGKKPRARAAAKTPKSSAKRVKRQPKQNKGKGKRGRLATSSSEDEDEDSDVEAPPAKVPQLVLTTKSAARRPAKERAASQATPESSTQARPRRAKAAYSPASSAQPHDDDDDDQENVPEVGDGGDGGDDDDLETSVFVKSAAKPATKPVAVAKKATSPAQRPTPTEEDAISDDGNDQVIGFRSKISLGR